MKLSTRTRYGFRAIMELVENYGHGPLQLNVIAKREDISLKYLEQLMAILKSAGFVRSVRGAKGGYILAKAPNQIKLSDIFNALEGPMMTVECVGDKSRCSRVVDCVTRELWIQVQDAIEKVLKSMTLQELADKAQKSKTSYYQI